MSRTLEYDVYTHFRGESFLQVRHPIQWRIALQAAQQTIFEVRDGNSSNYIPTEAGALFASEGQIICRFGVFRKRVAQRFEFLLQTVEGLQRNDQFPIRPAGAHYELRDAAGNLLQA